MKKFKSFSLKSLVPQASVPKPRKPATRLAARLTQPAYDDYDEEPTTKLSTAFVVVFVLHLVAVGGIYAFHSIKAKRRDADGTGSLVTAAVNETQKSETTKAATANTGSPVVQAVAGPQPVAPLPITGAAPAPKTAVPAQSQGGPSALLPQQAPSTVANKHGASQPQQAGVSKTPSAGNANAPLTTSSSAASAASDAAGKTYTVVKGDNPERIAKRLGVNYGELLKINGIDDPKKLQIGQVLKLPVKKQSSSN